MEFQARFRRLVASSLGLSALALSSTSQFLTLDSQVFGTERPALTENKQQEAAKKPKDETRFVRVDRQGDTPRALQTAVAKYEIQSGPYKGVKVDLVGAVHIGSKEYYQELNKRFKKYDAVLYELVADESSNKPDARQSAGLNPLAGLQTGMKEALQLSYQLIDVDYSPKNFIHADMSPAEFMADMEERKDGFIGTFARLLGAGIAEQSTRRGQRQQAEMMSAMLSKDPIKMRRVLAEQFDSMNSQMAGFADKDGKSTILTERNRKAFEVLSQELENGKKNIAVFYGAAHLPDMHQRLINDHQATMLSIEWVDAWPLK